MNPYHHHHHFPMEWHHYVFKILYSFVFFVIFFSLIFEECELPVQQPTDSENKTHCSPKLSLNNTKTKQQTDVAKQARSIVPTNNGTQTGLEVRCEETQTDRMPGPGFILAEHQDYLRRYSMEEVNYFLIKFLALCISNQLILVSKINTFSPCCWWTWSRYCSITLWCFRWFKVNKRRKKTVLFFFFLFSN